MAAVREYFAQLAVCHQSLHWEPQGWDWSLADDSGAWTIVELVTGPDLYEEGQAMRHCAGLYAPRCAASGCAVFSLRRNGLRVLTVELEPRSRRILQARGHSNRRPTVQERDILGRWGRSFP